MTEPHDPRNNLLLACLPDAEWKRWEPLLELVHLPLGKSLYESGEHMRFVCFPTTGIVSLLHVLETGSSAQTAVVGNEGVVGISIFMGGNTTTSRAVVQHAGMGYRLRADTIKRDFDTAGPVMHVMLRYTQALLTQMCQTAVCNRHHSLDQQLCRWLLLGLDRLTGNEIVMSQELIADMLGVQREGVTQAAFKLQAAGIIRYSQGHITVLDRPKLEVRTCECYEVVRAQYERLLPDFVPI